MSRTARGLAPLRHRGYRRLAAGQFASNTGDAFYAVALPWYILAGHGGVLLLATVLATYGLARTILIPAGGHACDRWRPWSVMMASDTVRALAALFLTITAALGPAHAAILLPFAVVIGAGEAMFLPGSLAIIPALLPGEQLQAGNALATAGTTLAMLTGAATGGVTVALFGPAPAFALDAATFAISATTLAALRTTRHTHPPTSTPAGTPARGHTPDPTRQHPGPAPGPAPGPGAVSVRALLRSSRVLQIALLIAAAANLGSGGAIQVALPALAAGPLHTGAAGYGWLVAVFGAGALLGTLTAGQASHPPRPAITASIVFLIEALSMALVPYLATALGAGAALAVWGAMNGYGNIVMITAWQRWAPPHLLGRLTALVMTATFGVFPASVLLGGIIVHNLGPAICFPLGAAALTTAITLGLTQPTWRNLGATPTEPTDPTRHTPTATATATPTATPTATATATATIEKPATTPATRHPKVSAA